ncbi:MAG: hypothetical protein ACXAAH_14685, partial [Promethearchaeota archaeon]
MTTGIIYDDIYLQHKIGTHVESHERLIEIIELLKRNNIINHPNFKLIKPRKATLEQLKYVHVDSLINEIRDIADLAEKTGYVQSIDLDT